MQIPSIAPIHSPAELPAAQTKVLVVDDMPQNLLAMQALLESDRVAVLPASSGAQALEMLLQHDDVALALVDVQMPDMDGFGLAELMRGTERTRSIPIIFATAASQSGRRTFRGYEAGAVDFLYKPIDTHVLTSKVAVFVDLYDQKRQLRERMAQLERVVKLNEMMAAVLSHDLRTPLSAIALGAEVVYRMGQPESVQRAGGRIKASAKRMTQMIDQLLDFSRIRSGGLKLHPQPAQLALVCEAVAAEIKGARPEADIQIQTRGDLSAMVDVDRMMQVFSNLLGNAVTHGAAGSPVRVSLDGTEPQAIRVCIVNEGVIPEQVRAQLFTPFRTNPHSDSGGLGLGLYIVQQFVAMHGGQVEARSSDDEGTSFMFDVPRSRGTCSALP